MARRFSAKQETVYRELINLMKKLNATSLRIGEQDLLGTDPTAKITFDRGGIRYISSCATYPVYLDNLRAAHLAVEYTYRIADAYGVDIMQEEQVQDLLTRLFGSLEAPLDPNALLLGDGSDHWYDVLGVNPGASRAAIVNAYKALCKVHHPDVGGNNDDFLGLRNAYEEGITETNKESEEQHDHTI